MARRLTATAHLLLLAGAATAGQRDAVFPSGEDALDAAAASRLRGLRARLPYADRIFASRAAPARATAAALGLAAQPASALAECDYGRWRGRTLAEVEGREPDGLSEWLSDPMSTPHGGESLAALLARVGGWLDAEMAERGVILAVAPASVVRAALTVALAAGPPTFWRLDVAPLTLARLSGHGGRWRLSALTPLDLDP